MAQHYDVSLKLLFQKSQGLVARQLFGGPVKAWLNIELPTVQNLRVDLLARSADKSLRHVELESRNTRDIGRRVAEYYLGFHRQLSQHVEMVVLYVGKEPMRILPGFHTPSMQFEFRLLDIREFDGEPLIRSEDLGDNMLALLTNSDQERVLQRVEERLIALRPGEKEAAAQLFVVLSGLRGLEETVKRRLNMIDIMENKVLGPAILKGMHQGQVKMLNRVLENKFGDLPGWVTDKLENAKEKQLMRWMDRALTAKDLNAVFKK